MDNLNFEKYKQILKNEILYKTRAVELLADYFACNKHDLFYLFQKNKFPQKGKITDKILFFFHGLGCTVKNEEEGWSSTLEFGPKGETLAFDKGTICYMLNVHMDYCDKLINLLIENKIVRFTDKKLYNLLKENPNYNDWHSEEEEIDAMVADKLIVI